jgi:hypothetical protein
MLCHHAEDSLIARCSRVKHISLRTSIAGTDSEPDLVAAEPAEVLYGGPELERNREIFVVASTQMRQCHGSMELVMSSPQAAVVQAGRTSLATRHLTELKAQMCTEVRCMASAMPRHHFGSALGVDACYIGVFERRSAG